MPKVFTTFQPWVELDVDDVEYAYLKASGFVVGEEEKLGTNEAAQRSTPADSEDSA